MEKILKCSGCNGNGYVNGVECKKCGGTGYPRKKVKKTLTQRVEDTEFLLGRLLSKIDQIELVSHVKEDEFGAPRRAGVSWTDKERLSLSKAFLIFVEARAVYHKRTVDAILARIEHEGWLHEAELREDITVYEKNQLLQPCQD